MPLLIECVFTDAGGVETSRYRMDYANPTSRAAFARQSETTLKKGGSVLTRAVEHQTTEYPVGDEG